MCHNYLFTQALQRHILTKNDKTDHLCEQSLPALRQMDKEKCLNAANSEMCPPDPIEAKIRKLMPNP
jgi:hypothetical protein